MEHYQEPEGYDEAELVRAAQKGHRAAFALLYEANVERVYRYLLARLGQPADAEDVTAEVFILAMKGLGSYKQKGTPLIAWLYRIAHNQAINYWKKTSRRAESTLDDLAATADDTAEEALTMATFGEASRAMEELTELQRQVISLRFVGELSIAEAAKIMGRSQGAVKFLQHSALQALRRILEERAVTSRGR